MTHINIRYSILICMFDGRVGKLCSQCEEKKLGIYLVGGTFWRQFGYEIRMICFWQFLVFVVADSECRSKVQLMSIFDAGFVSSESFSRNDSGEYFLLHNFAFNLWILIRFGQIIQLKNILINSFRKLLRNYEENLLSDLVW